MESDAQSSAQGPAPSADQDPQPKRRPRQPWSDFIEEVIRAAQERGAFANLAGAGKPLNLDGNPYAGDRALAFSLLESNDLAPREIELGHEIDAELARAEAIVVALRRRTHDLAQRRLPPFASERRAYNVLRSKSQSRYVEALRAVNSRILSLNIMAPPAMHRRIVDVEARMRAFQAEFPPLAV
jgi:DnaJ family protein C protein 28